MNINQYAVYQLKDSAELAAYRSRSYQYLTEHHFQVIVQNYGKSKRVAKSSRLIWNGTGSDEQVLSWRYSNPWDRTCFHFDNKK